MRVALVHDWLVAQRGGENVLLELARAFPDAPIYTVVHRPGSVDPEIERHPIRTSFVQHLPASPRRFRQYLPLFPAAVERWDLTGYDVVLSTSHCVAKGVLTTSRQRHLSYIHTPMRYLWDQLPQYVPEWPSRRAWTAAAWMASTPLRRWDVKSAARPDVLIANSDYVARRIARVWGRTSEVLYPPVDVEFFRAAPARERRGLLVVSALVPYKRVDLAVRLATRRGLKLTVVGDGSEREKLERMAGPTVRFLQGLSREDLRAAYAEAEVLVFGGVEDFGIVPVEAMAAGCPVVALGEGGATETVVDGTEDPTGVLFAESTLEALDAGWMLFQHRREQGLYRRSQLEQHAARFGVDAFRRGMARLLETYAPGATQTLHPA